MATEVLSAEEVQVADLADQLIAQHPPASTPAIAFLGAQFDLGLAWVHFPVGHGGLGLSPKFQKIVNEKIARAEYSKSREREQELQARVDELENVKREEVYSCNICFS